MSKKTRVKSFAVGDRVSWTSQANGSWKQKTGTIVEVVPANHFAKKGPSAGIRNHETYVVSVIHSSTTKPELYRPIVSKLHLVKRGSTSAAKAAARPHPTGVTDPVPESAGDPYLAGIMNRTSSVASAERAEGEAIKHAADCPQDGPPRDGGSCCCADADVDDVSPGDLPPDVREKRMLGDMRGLGDMIEPRNHLAFGGATDDEDEDRTQSARN